MKKNETYELFFRKYTLNAKTIAKSIFSYLLKHRHKLEVAEGFALQGAVFQFGDSQHGLAFAIFVVHRDDHDATGLHLRHEGLWKGGRTRRDDDAVEGLVGGQAFETVAEEGLDAEGQLLQDFLSLEVEVALPLDAEDLGTHRSQDAGLIP